VVVSTSTVGYFLFEIRSCFLFSSEILRHRHQPHWRLARGPLRPATHPLGRAGAADRALVNAWCPVSASWPRLFFAVLVMAAQADQRHRQRSQQDEAAKSAIKTWCAETPEDPGRGQQQLFTLVRSSPAPEMPSRRRFLLGVCCSPASLLFRRGGANGWRLAAHLARHPGCCPAEIGRMKARSRPFFEPLLHEAPASQVVAGPVSFSLVPRDVLFVVALPVFLGTTWAGRFLGGGRLSWASWVIGYGIVQAAARIPATAWGSGGPRGPCSSAVSWKRPAHRRSSPDRLALWRAGPTSWRGECVVGPGSSLQPSYANEIPPIHSYHGSGLCRMRNR